MFYIQETAGKISGSLFKAWLALCLYFAPPALSFAAGNDPLNPIILYGPEIEFSVLRDGVQVGRHVVTFERKNDTITAKTVFSIKVTFFSIPLYSYDYRSVAKWENGAPSSIVTEVDDDGKKSQVTGTRLKNSFAVNGRPIAVSQNTIVYPTNHWNSAVLKQSEVFNTITGRMNEVIISNLGPEEVDIKGGTIIANRYEYTGELSLDSWYDRDGRWVKLKFIAEDGSTIEYFCITCTTGRGK